MRAGLALAAVLAASLTTVVPVAAAATAQKVLTVCADPNNLPFSNQAREGFENRIAELIARELHARISYVWWAQRRAYVRNTLSEARCDLWPGIAAGVERVASTHAYYRSTYVFVTRASQSLAHLSLDDPRLAGCSIGVQMIGNDARNTPPAHAIASRGLVNNVHGYMLYGDYTQPNPPAAIVDAVAHGDIDVGLVWGPLAGFFAHRSKVRLRIEPVTPADDARWPMQFDIAMGVRPANATLLAQVNEILERDEKQIRQILNAYQIPQVSRRS